MEAFVPGYQHDVFISYAHVDNEPVLGAQEGWVSTLVKGLRLLLARKLGRANGFSLWMDYRLPANAPITPELVHNIEQSAALVLILSPGYLASEWCQRERNAFLQMTKQRASAGMRVFVVEMDRIEDDERPHEIEDLLGYRFWIQEPEDRAPRILGMPTPNPEEQLYYNKLNDLAHDLAEELKHLRDTAGTTSETRPPSRPAVFLADVTDDLLIQQVEVKRYLDQAGINVLPETPLYFTAPEDLQEVIDDNLQHCRLFVQLLSELPGRSLPGQTSYCRLQYERAQLAGKPVLQWHRPDLDPANTPTSDQRSLLEGESVLAVGLEEFKREIITRTLPKPSTKKITPSVGALVFPDTSAEDREFADIFISYSQKDRAWVKRLVDALTAEGYEVWWDLKIRAGESFDELIESTLEKVSCVVGVWSKNSVKSEWVRAESAWAKDHRIFISVRVEDDAQLPLKFYHVHTASMADWDGSPDAPAFRSLVKDVAVLAGIPSCATRK